MNKEIAVTIATSLEVADILTTEKFDFTSVLDLRRSVKNGPFPIEECVLRRLANFRVSYTQMPIGMHSPSAVDQHNLTSFLNRQNGKVLVISEHAVPLARFCRDREIPFRSRDLYIVETAGDYIPVQLQNRERVAVGSSFGSFGG